MSEIFCGVKNDYFKLQPFYYLKSRTKCVLLSFEWCAVDDLLLLEENFKVSTLAKVGAGDCGLKILFLNTHSTLNIFLVTLSRFPCTS